MIGLVSCLFVYPMTLLVGIDMMHMLFDFTIGILSLGDTNNRSLEGRTGMVAVIAACW